MSPYLAWIGPSCLGVGRPAAGEVRRHLLEVALEARPARSAPAAAPARRPRSRTRAGCRAASRPAPPVRPPPPRRRSARPRARSSTNEYSSSCWCVCVGAASARGGISCSISAKLAAGRHRPQDHVARAEPAGSRRRRSSVRSHARMRACTYALLHVGGPKRPPGGRLHLRYKGGHVDLPPDNPRRPRLCFISGRRRATPAWRRSWTRSSRSTSTCTWRATWACRSSTSSRRTTTPTTSPATGGWPTRPARRSTCTASAQPDYDHEPFDDGWELALGSVRVRALHTPGHRPEHTAFALIDTARGPEPWAVLTGDTLFVGDIARPDLAVDKRGGGARHLPLPARAAAQPRRQRRGVARASRRLPVRGPRAWT